MPNQTKIHFNVKKLVKYFENLAGSENYGKSEKNFSYNDICIKSIKNTLICAK